MQSARTTLAMARREKDTSPATSTSGPFPCQGWRRSEWGAGTHRAIVYWVIEERGETYCQRGRRRLDDGEVKRVVRDLGVPLSPSELVPSAL